MVALVVTRDDLLVKFIGFILSHKTKLFPHKKAAAACNKTAKIRKLRVVFAR
jgi:hypothetical protein